MEYHFYDCDTPGCNRSAIADNEGLPPNSWEETFDPKLRRMVHTCTLCLRDIDHRLTAAARAENLQQTV